MQENAMIRTLLDAATSTGEGQKNSNHKWFSDSTYIVTTVGSPSAVTIDIEGSFDGVTFFQIAQHILTAAEISAQKAIFHIAGKPVLFSRANLITFTGGTSATVEQGRAD